MSTSHKKPVFMAEALRLGFTSLSPATSHLRLEGVECKPSLYPAVLDMISSFFTGTLRFYSCSCKPFKSWVLGFTMSDGMSNANMCLVAKVQSCQSEAKAEASACACAPEYYCSFCCTAVHDRMRCPRFAIWHARKLATSFGMCKSSAMVEV